jgi:sterol desaturase/sphingolipid hydroxylase (fatty acid hydroxylase superfamily)
METLNKLLAIDINYIVVGLIVIFYAMENLFATQFRYAKMHQHLLHNVLMQAAIYLGSLITAIIVVNCIQWLNNHEIGMFYLVELPLWLKLVLGVMMFDFVNYWFHRTAHRAPVLWRFHRVHHSDIRMDASTNLRSHPVELLLYFGLSNVVAAAIFGLDVMSLGVFFLIITPYVFLEHSNIKFPAWLDKSVGLIFTTPNIHKVHHEQDQYYTDSNYADIFIIWDRLFGTYKYKPTSEIKFGLKEFDDDKKQTFWYLMRSPFINMSRVTSEELRKNK